MIRLGLYAGTNAEEMAALVYDAAARLQFGDAANVNFARDDAKKRLHVGRIGIWKLGADRRINVSSSARLKLCSDYQ